MTGPDPTERAQTQPPGEGAAPSTAPASTPPPSAAPPPPTDSPPPTAPPPSSNPPPPPAWRPPPADRGGTASVVVGAIIIVIGLWFFATRTLGLDLPRFDWGQLWPVILIVIGGWVIYSSFRRAR